MNDNYNFNKLHGLDGVKIIKNTGAKENFNKNKLIEAANKSANRKNVTLSEEQEEYLVESIAQVIVDRAYTEVSVSLLHTMVEDVLEVIDKRVAASYKNYRNWKTTEAEKFWKEVFDEAERIRFLGDKENANKDSALVATRRCLLTSAVEKKLYRMTFLTDTEKASLEKGAYYIHDEDFRPDTVNCCNFDIRNVLSGGFELGNIWYNEPKSLDVAFDVIGDIVLATASQQYGGFTLPQIDEVLTKYAKMSYEKYYEEAIASKKKVLSKRGLDIDETDIDDAKSEAMAHVEYDYKQGWQGWEIKFNTVGSSRGDYPFITVTLGLDVSEFGKMCNKVAFREHAKGQGKPGKKKSVLFPKYVFLYDKNLHGKGKIARDVFDEAIDCSRKVMYPDWLSLTGEGYVPSMYIKYGKVVSPMGCRAFLSPYYEIGKLTGEVDEDGNEIRDHFYPAEDMEDYPVFIGRFNGGAISLNLPLIYLESMVNNQEFFSLLDEYLEEIRNLHKRTKSYIGNFRASQNPLAFCEGGFYGGNLKPHQKLKESKKLMEATTYSFGVTALNELQEAYNGKSLYEDGKFALEVLKHINEKTEQFKKEDHILYAVYGTPAESLCGKQIAQLRTFTQNHMFELIKKKYEVMALDNGDVAIPGVCDRDYVSNSFHCHVSEDITGVDKQQKEKQYWNYCNGGKIQYVRYDSAAVRDNREGVIQMVEDFAMEYGFYEGLNLAMNYCDDCGHEQIDMPDVCPCCGSKNITKIDRMNGYLSYSRVKGDSRLNKAKMAEIADRKSM